MFLSFIIALILPLHATGQNYGDYVSTYPSDQPKTEVKLTPEQESLAKYRQEISEYQTKYTGYSYSTQNMDPYPNGYLMPLHYIYNPVPLEEEMTFDKLNALIQTKKLTTIESVIAELPSHMKDGNYVIMYRSRSMQDASPISPRAIIYTPTANFIATFNGGKKSQRGNNTMEFIQFQQKEKRYELRELTFNGKDLPAVSEANPKKCLECHQSPNRKNVDPRPNWEPYFAWLGAFGSADGRLGTNIKDDDRLQPFFQPQDAEALEEQTHEFEFFKNYIDIIAPVHPRFQFLGQMNLKAPLNLTENLTIWSLARAMRLFSEDKEVYDLYKETVAYMVRCPDVSKFVDKSPALQWHASFKYPQYFEYKDTSMFGSASRIITSLLEPLGIDTSDWSNDFGTGGRFGFRERFGPPSTSVTLLKYAWHEVVPDAEELSKIPCDQLATTALTKIDTAFKNGVQQQMQLARQLPAPKGEDVIRRCQTCHVELMDPLAPIFPFDQPTVLVPLLQKPYSAHGTLFEEINYRTSDMALRKHQMPPTRRLTRLEHEALMKYLKEIK